MTTVEELLACIDRDIERGDRASAYALIPEMAGSVSRLVPALVTALQDFLGEENFYGRDVVASALAEIAGIESLPDLLRAAAVDIGDDQDTLTAVILDVISLDALRAGEIVDELANDGDLRLRQTALWARQFIEP